MGDVQILLVQAAKFWFGLLVDTYSRELSGTLDNLKSALSTSYDEVGRVGSAHPTGL